MCVLFARTFSHFYFGFFGFSIFIENTSLPTSVLANNTKQSSPLLLIVLLSLSASLSSPKTSSPTFVGSSDQPLTHTHFDYYFFFSNFLNPPPAHTHRQKWPKRLTCLWMTSSSATAFPAAGEAGAAEPLEAEAPELVELRVEDELLVDEPLEDVLLAVEEEIETPPP